MVNLMALGTVGKRFRKSSAAKRQDKESSRFVSEALVLPPAHVSPAQAEHFVQFALAFLH